mgnify:CR=1 FL=1
MGPSNNLHAVNGLSNDANASVMIMKDAVEKPILAGVFVSQKGMSSSDRCSAVLRSAHDQSGLHLCISTLVISLKSRPSWSPSMRSRSHSS